MEFWSVFVICGLALCVVGLLLYLFSLRASLKEVARELNDKLNADTNTLLSLSSGDRAMRTLAVQINDQLRLLRRERLRLQNGDAELKATQGDTGHAEIDMITSIYAHILDEDKKVNAQKFETAFYANPDLRRVKPPEEPKQAEPAALDLASLVEQLQQSPEPAQALASLISAQTGSR